MNTFGNACMTCPNIALNIFFFIMSINPKWKFTYSYKTCVLVSAGSELIFSSYCLVWYFVLALVVA